MTNDEKIKDQYRLLGLAINWRGPDKHNQLKCIRRHLDAIRELSEPESLASSVLRLTNICNELGRENALLRNELTDMTLNYNAAEKHAKHLEEEVVRKDDDLALTSNAWLRGQLTQKDQSLRACRAAEKALKHDLEQASWDATKLKRELALKEQCLTRVQSRLEWIKQGLEGHSVKEENRKLKQELALQQRYIELLKKEREQDKS